MVTVEFSRSRTFGYYKAVADNHADDPLICSAVSAIMQGLAGSLMNIEPKAHVERLIIESGHLEIEVRPALDEVEQKIFDTLFFFAQVSLMQIEKRYPQNVVVNVNNY